MRKWVRSNGYPKEVLEAIRELLNTLNPFLLPEAKQRCADSDCMREHGMTVATLDKDFERMPWLETIP